MEHRTYPRIHFREQFAHISDNKNFFRGTVQNVSRFGLCLKDLPADIDDTIRTWSVLVNHQGTTYKLSAVPKWSTLDGQKKSVGVEILDAPLEWTDFLIDISLLIEAHSKQRKVSGES